ncbi:hypothetical protein ACJRO7_022305, partial [Eucalyptus globulus]
LGRSNSGGRAGGLDGLTAKKRAAATSGNGRGENGFWRCGRLRRSCWCRAEMAELSQESRTGRGAGLQRQLSLELAGRRKVAAGVVAASTLGAHQQEGDDGVETVGQAGQGVELRRWAVSRMELGGCWCGRSEARLWVWAGRCSRRQQ